MMSSLSQDQHAPESNEIMARKYIYEECSGTLVRPNEGDMVTYLAMWLDIGQGKGGEVDLSGANKLSYGGWPTMRMDIHVNWLWW